MATIPPAVLQMLRESDTPTVWNSLSGLVQRDRTEGVATVDLRCQFPELKPIVGYAVTCTVAASAPGPRRPNALAKLLETIEQAPKPVVVAMHEVDAQRGHAALIGDILASIFQRLSCAGLVTDGAIRDRAGIRRRAPGFQVFTPGSAAGAGNFAVLEIGVPVTICGLAIAPGDLLHGDESGLIGVPIDHVEAIARGISKVMDFERSAFEYLENEAFSAKEWQRRFMH